MAHRTAPERLRAWRKRVGLSQQEMADLFGRDRTWISKLEHDGWTPPAEDREAIERLTSGEVKADWWLTSEERARSRRLRHIGPYEAA